MDLIFKGSVEFAAPVATPGAPAVTTPATPGATRARQDRPAPGPVPRILCVDDEPHVLEGLTLNLGRRYDVQTAGSGAAALELLQNDPQRSLIISDMRMPGMDGATFLSKARLVDL